MNERTGPGRGRGPLGQDHADRAGPEDVTETLPAGASAASAAGPDGSDQTTKPRQVVEPESSEHQEQTAASGGSSAAVPTGAAATGRLLRALAVMGSGTMVSRLLGFVRVMLAAFVIGNGTRQADAYALALTVPTALYILFAGGALNSVFVPQLTRAAHRDSDGGEAFTNRIITAFLSILLVVTVVATLAAPLIMRIYASPAWRTPEMAEHWRALIFLAMVCLPEVFFYGAFVVLGQVLNARDRFGPMMWAPVASNIIQVLSFLVFLAAWGQSEGGEPFSTGQIWVLGGGYLLGSFLQAGVLVHCLRRIGYRYRPRFDLRGTGLAKTFRLAGWALGFVLVNQVALAVVSRLATAAPAAGGEGAGLNVYNNAYLVFLLPHSLITVALVTAMVTSASKLAAVGDTAGTAAEVMRTMRLVATALVPAALLLLAFGHPVAQVMFGNGRDDAHFVGWTIMAFAVGLVPFTIQSACLRTYYALERNKDTFFIQILIAGVQIAASLLLVVVLPLATPSTIAPLLALSFSIAYYVGVAVSFRHLRRYLPELSARELVGHVAQVTVAIAPFAALGWFITDRWGTTQALRILTLAIAGAIAAAGYLLLARALGITELTTVVARLTRRRAAGNVSADGAGVRPAPDDDAADRTAHADSAAGAKDHESAGLHAAVGAESDLQTRVQPAVATALPHGIRAPYDPDAPTTTAAAVDRSTEVRAAVTPPTHSPSDAETADPDAPTAAYAAGPASEDDEDTDEIEDGDDPGIDPDTAEEVHPVRVRPGRVLGGRYKLEEPIVRRTDTQTWLAQDKMLSRPVLIHLLPPGQDADELLAAARRAAVATDSRFLRVLDAHTGDAPLDRKVNGRWWTSETEEPTGPYIVCEYAPGQSLEQLLASGPLSALEAAWVVREVADGLAGMHEQALYHERINPDTVVITATGNVKIVGFLLESEFAPVRRHPLTDDADPQAVDVLDLGRLLYCTLVSRWPGGHAHGMAAAPTDSEGHLLTPRQVRAGVSPALDSICDRILSPIPRHREDPLRTAQEIVRALNQVLGTANAAHDLERRLRYPIPVVDISDEDTPSQPGGSSEFATAAGLSIAPHNDPEATTGRIPAVSRVSELPTGPLQPVSQATPSDPPSERRRRTTPRQELEDDGFVRGDPPRRWIPAMVLVTLAVLVGSLIVVGLQLAPNAGERGGDPTPWQISAATDFDPQGSTRQENPEQVSLAFDGDPTTAWTTVDYAQPDLSGKDGVGIIVDLGEVREVARADLALADPGTSVEMRIPRSDPEDDAVAPTDDLFQWREIASAERAPAQVTLLPDTSVRTRFVLIFLTELPPAGANYRGGIAEVVLWG